MSAEIYVPGKGEIRFDPRVREAVRAVEEYDPDLTLGRHAYTGDWVIFIRHGDQEPFPVYGLGQELPSADEIKRHLYTGDVRRHGANIVKHILARQDERQRDAKRRADDATAVAAEALDFHTRKQIGSRPKVFIPAEMAL